MSACTGGPVPVLVVMMMVVTGSTFAHKLVFCSGKNGEGDEDERKSKFHGWQWMAVAVIVGVEMEQSAAV
jgi:hypothetical protein